MKVIFYSDGYAHGVMGTKRSLYEELIRRKHPVKWEHRKEVKNIIPLVQLYKPDQIWFAHSGLMIPYALKRQINVPIVGFGFSDPYNFKTARFNSYDAYITYHFATWKKYYNTAIAGIPMFCGQTACDLKFHKDLKSERTVDISMMGIGRHPRFKNPDRRIKYVNRLRKETKFRILIGGRHWAKHRDNLGHIDGMKFLGLINRSRIGLDIQEDWSPLAHKMFEYSACGTPIITCERPEVHRVFDVGNEILTYKDYGDLKEKLLYYLIKEPEELMKIGERARERCIKDHNISNRMDEILKFLKSAFTPCSKVKNMN